VHPRIPKRKPSVRRNVFSFVFPIREDHLICHFLFVTVFAVFFPPEEPSYSLAVWNGLRYTALAMEGTTNSLSVPWPWRVAFFIPLTTDIVLQFISHRATDVHTSVRISMIGNTCLFVSLIAIASYWVRQSREWWRIVMLILTSAGLGFGLAALLHAHS